MKLGTVVVLGIFIVLAMPELKMPAVTPFIDGSGFVVPGPVFPFVCITIACGAVSGFHALISSGTTPKLLERERDVRVVGYGAMVTEMLVALMAIIAASALPPGQYFAINSPVNARDAVAVERQIEKINSYGPAYRVTLEEMEELAEKIQEPTLIGKTGGAPTFAVGMASMFSRVLPGDTALALWYHFAIMFEALFILTTLDGLVRVVSVQAVLDAVCVRWPLSHVRRARVNARGMMGLGQAHASRPLPVGNQLLAMIPIHRQAIMVFPAVHGSPGRAGSNFAELKIAEV
jgi:carbon starvation protein